MYMSDEVTLGPDIGGYKLTYVTVLIMAISTLMLGILVNPIYKYITLTLNFLS
jgi:hypothetical protein